jgi:phosphosulfolactate synthase
MNFNLTQMPERTVRPRQHGITMVMDKGLSVQEAKNFMSVAYPHVDVVKLGFGTSYVTPTLKEKLEVYRSYDIPVYFGGTLFEAFLIRNQFEDYINGLTDQTITLTKIDCDEKPTIADKYKIEGQKTIEYR